jgi:hypothetical protein
MHSLPTPRSLANFNAIHSYTTKCNLPFSSNFVDKEVIFEVIEDSEISASKKGPQITLKNLMGSKH